MAVGSCYDTCPVDRKSRSIRLIRLLESSSADLIECEMTSFELFNCPSYVAVSYTWGTTRSTSVIKVNDVLLTIQENQRQFLAQKRGNGEREYYWIDALCIDQANVYERNHQVGLMRDIYSKAAVTHVWLGARTPDSDVAMDYIRNFRTAQKHTPTRRLWSHAQGKAILDLCQHRYWRRIWIIQEVLLAQDIVMCYGDRIVDWADLGAVLKCLKGIEDSGRIHGYSHAAAVLESDATRIVESKSRWPNFNFESRSQAFEYLIATYHDMESSEVRDRIYGFLGLVDDVKVDEDSVGFRADYSLPTPQILSQVYHYLQSAPEFHTQAAKLKLLDRLRDQLRVSPRDLSVETAKASAMSECHYQPFKVPPHPSSFAAKAELISEYLVQHLDPDNPIFLRNQVMEKRQTFSNPLEGALVENRDDANNRVSLQCTQDSEDEKTFGRVP